MSRKFLSLGPDGLGTYEADGTKRLDEPADHLLIPGFVDIHIHGGVGIDFMSASTAEIIQWCVSLKNQGYEGFLPTTVTASPKDVQQALRSLPEHEMILGFHLEGPFISPKFPGAQPPEWIVEPPNGPSEWDAILDDPRLRVVTLAPEQPGALDLIKRLNGRGVIASIGHTNATYAECKAADQAGAKHTTHTYNAMRPLHHREAGTVGYALSSDRLACELIYDRHHVCKEAAALLIKNKPSDKVIAISDATMAAGLPSGSELNMWGLNATVQDNQVRLRDGTLAGSAITLLDAFRNLHDDFGPELAIRACCINPRLALGISEPHVFVVLDPQLQVVGFESPESLRS